MSPCSAPPSTQHRSTLTRRLSTSLVGGFAVVVAAVTVVVTGLAPAPPVRAATITAAYAVGHRQVTINDYGTQGLGVFVLRGDDGDPFAGERLALCLEAHRSHSTAPGRYRLVENQVVSPQLDYLLWRYGWPGTAEHVDLRNPGPDHDTATALGALAWYYAGAQRRQGGSVWANHATGFSPLSPVHPHRWDALPGFGAGFPVGLRSGGTDLDGAERRVLELFLEAESRQGPWVMSPISRSGDHVTVTVTGPAGPIRSVDGVRFVVRDHRGTVIANDVTRTDGNGTAAVRVGTMPDGGSVAVSMFAPGVHQEWDGDGDVQRMSTATGRRLDRSLTLPPLPHHVHVEKRSSDPLFGVEGARFELIDADDRTIGSATTDATGTARFDPVDPAAHRRPYSIRETRAPDGLRPHDADVVVDAPSADPQRPTVVVIDNAPVEHGLRVRKALSDPRVGPPDRSGFEFEVTRLDDQRSFGTARTEADGRTSVLMVTRGRFRVCERGRPAWAEHLDDPGCVDVDVGPDAPVVDVTYTNLVPVPTIGTRVVAQGRDDGTHRRTPAVLTEGDALVDLVSFDRLVPGTDYELRGEIHDLGGEVPVPTGIVGSEVFVPDSPSGTVEVRFDVPAESVDTGVVYQHLLLDGRVVASHADPRATEQTFWMPSLTTTAGLTEHGVIDTAEFAGLPPGTIDARVDWYVRDDDGTCHPTGLTATETFVAEHHQGVVTVGPLEVGDHLLGTTLVAFHHLLDAQGRTLAAHTDCGAAEQTVHVPPPAASTTTSSTTAAPSTTSTIPTSTTTTTPSSSPPPADAAPPRPTPTTTNTTTTTTTSTTSTTVGPGPASSTLPRTGQGAQLPTGVALMSVGAGGLALVAAAVTRRRPR